MGTLVCENCGRVTNTAVSDWMDRTQRNDGMATRCFAAYEEEQWVKGCAYDRANPYEKPGIDSLIFGNRTAKRVFHCLEERDAEQ